MKTSFALLALASVTLCQESALPFDASQVVLPPNVPLIKRLLHLNEDGIPDAVGLQNYNGGTNPDEVRIGIYHGTGDGGFAQQATLKIVDVYPTLDYPVAAGDFDGDGLDDDFVVPADNRIYAYRGNGASLPTLMGSVAIATNYAMHFEVVDIDGDGRDDLVAATRESAGQQSLNVVISAADWGTSSVGSINLGFEPAALALFDRAGQAFAAMTYSTGSPAYELQVHTFDVTSGAPVFEATHVLPTNGNYWQSAELVGGDVDGDGDDDLVAFLLNDHYCLRATNGAFVLEPPRVGGPATDLFDIDGDGDLDGVCCGGGGGPSTSNHTQGSAWEIALNDGTGVFQPAYPIIGSAGRGWAGAMDVDSDGDLDLVAGRSTYFNLGGNFAPPPAGYAPADRSGGLADADGDGDLDVSVALQNGVLPTYFENHGDEGFTFTTFPTTGFPSPWSGSYTAAVGDFDLDGDPDAIIGFYMGAAPDECYFVENVAGKMIYSATQTTDVLPYGTGSRNSITMDWDRDGDFDVVQTNTSTYQFNFSANTRVYENDGAADFTEVFHDTTFTILNLVDLDGDGIDDFFGAAATGLGWRKALATGGWGSYVPLPGSLKPDGRVALADFDLDGDVDVMSFMVDQETPLAFLNDGVGNFTTQLGVIPIQETASNGITMSWRALDFDADGREDLLLAPGPSGTNNCKLFRNTSVGGSLAFEFVCEQSFSGWNAHDQDLDGDLDVVGAVVHANKHADAALAGSMAQYGEATPGSGGYVPRLGVGRSYRAGSFARFGASGVKGGLFTILAFGLVPAELANFPSVGVTAYLNPATVATIEFPMPGPPIDGEGEFVINYYVPPGIAGATFYHQLFAVDGGAPSGFAASRALRVTYGMP